MAYEKPYAMQAIAKILKSNGYNKARKWTQSELLDKMIKLVDLKPKN